MSKIVITFLPMQFANAILKKRTEVDNLSFSQLATITGVPRTRLHRIESGDVPKLENYHSICKWLGVSMDTFFTQPAEPKVAKAKTKKK